MFVYYRVNQMANHISLTLAQDLTLRSHIYMTWTEDLGPAFFLSLYLVGYSNHICQYKSCKIYNFKKLDLLPLEKAYIGNVCCLIPLYVFAYVTYKQN